MNEKKISLFGGVVLVSLLFSIASYGPAAIIQAVIPAVVPAVNKIGNGTRFQLGAPGAVAGDCATYDAGLNLTGAGTGGGCGVGGGSVSSVDGTAQAGVETIQGGVLAAITTAGSVRGASLVNVQTGTSYAFVTGDRAKLVTISNALPVAVSLPQAGVNFPAGWYVDIENTGVGTGTITPTTSTIDGAATASIATNQGMRIWSDGTNYFTQRGTGGAAVGVSGGVGLFASRSASPAVTGSFWQSTNSAVYSVWNGSSWVDHCFGSPCTLPTSSTLATIVNPGSSTQTFTTGPGVFTNAQATGGVFWGKALAANSAAFSMASNNVAFGVVGCGVAFRESSSGKILALNWNGGSARLDVASWTTATTFNTLVTNFSTLFQVVQGYAQPLYFFRARTNSTNIFFDVSTDGGNNWTQVFTEVKTAHFTTAPDQQGLWIANTSPNFDTVTLYSYVEN